MSGRIRITHCWVLALTACSESTASVEAGVDASTVVDAQADTPPDALPPADAPVDAPVDRRDAAADAVEAGAAPSRCEVIRGSVVAAGFADRVTVECDETTAYLTSDTYPDHTLMNGIVATNEQVPVPAAGHRVPVALNPRRAASPTTIDAALAVAVNGVPIYDYSAAGALDLMHYDARVDTVAQGQLDVCGGHAGRGDDYHYHATPTCMIARMRNAGDAAILGWGFDGYPLYGNRNPDGTPIAAGALDLCNGQPDPTFGYRYHTSTGHPYVLQCLVGEVDQTRLPRVAPLRAMTGGGGRTSGTPPAGGVQNLAYVVTPAGAHTLSYDYRGESYFIRYTPVGGGCYAFETRTVTEGDVVHTGTYCR